METNDRLLQAHGNDSKASQIFNFASQLDFPVLYVAIDTTKTRLARRNLTIGRIAKDLIHGYIEATRTGGWSA
jgi:hypothetical protein